MALQVVLVRTGIGTGTGTVLFKVFTSRRDEMILPV
jgi:hypothetical protein